MRSARRSAWRTRGGRRPVSIRNRASSRTYPTCATGGGDACLSSEDNEPGQIKFRPWWCPSVIARLHCLVLDCAEPEPLAAFYAQLLGMDRLDSTPDWVAIGDEATLPAILCQRVTEYRPPTWPSGAVPTQMHVDLLVDDLDHAEPRALALGATLLDGSDRPVGFRVYADPAGHPFCLVTPESVPWQRPGRPAP